MRRVAGVMLVGVLATACNDKAPENQVRVSGHVEATEVRLAPEVGGRIVLFKDACTGEWAMNPPERHARAPQVR